MGLYDWDTGVMGIISPTENMVDCSHLSVLCCPVVVEALQQDPYQMFK